METKPIHVIPGTSNKFINSILPVCYTCLFGPYEELKEPTVITPGWRYICFTDQDLTSPVWEIIKSNVPAYANPIKFARYYKIIEWVDWPRSIWIDASFVIATDLNKWWATHFDKGFAAPFHPLRDDVQNECLDCIISGRGIKEQVQHQMAEYKLANVNGPLIQSGLLMRENTSEVIELCERWWKEMEGRSTRDQIAFCRVAEGSEVVHRYRWDYRMGFDFIYKKHFKNR